MVWVGVGVYQFTFQLITFGQLQSCVPRERSGTSFSSWMWRWWAPDVPGGIQGPGPLFHPNKRPFNPLPPTKGPGGTLQAVPWLFQEVILAFGMKQRKKKDNSRMIARKKEGWEEVGEGKNSDGRRLCVVSTQYNIQLMYCRTVYLKAI